MPPFIIYALPRSRTAWLARFLNYGGWECHHDIVTEIFTVDGLRKFFERPLVGTVETAMIDGFALVRKLVPDARIVIIKRPIEEVRASLARFRIAGPEVDIDLERRNAALDAASKNPDVLTVPYDELSSETSCRAIFEFCLGIPMSGTWWHLLKDKNIQINMHDRVAKIRKNKTSMEYLKAEVQGFMGVA